MHVLPIEFGLLLLNIITHQRWACTQQGFLGSRHFGAPSFEKSQCESSGPRWWKCTALAWSLVPQREAQDANQKGFFPSRHKLLGRTFSIPQFVRFCEVFFCLTDVFVFQVSFFWSIEFNLQGCGYPCLWRTSNTICKRMLLDGCSPVQAQHWAF